VANLYAIRFQGNLRMTGLGLSLVRIALYIVEVWDGFQVGA
jgi:hypothetical protein